MKKNKAYYVEKEKRAAYERANGNVFGKAFDGCGVSDCYTYTGKPSHHLDYAVERPVRTLNEYGQKSRPVYAK